MKHDHHHILCIPQELSIYGKLRKVSNCGPVSMFRSLLVTWKGRYPPHVIAQRVKDFFRYSNKTQILVYCHIVLKTISVSEFCNSVSPASQTWPDSRCTAMYTAGGI